MRRASGRYLTKLSYRDIIIMGLKSKPDRITVNENTQSIDGSKTIWNDENRVGIFILRFKMSEKVDNLFLKIWSRFIM